VSLASNVQSNAGFNPFAGWSEQEDQAAPKGVKKVEEFTSTYEIKVESTKCSTTSNGWNSSDNLFSANSVAKTEKVQVAEEKSAKSSIMSASNTEENTKANSSDLNDMDVE